MERLTYNDLLAAKIRTRVLLEVQGLIDGQNERLATLEKQVALLIEALKVITEFTKELKEAIG